MKYFICSNVINGPSLHLLYLNTQPLEVKLLELIFTHFYLLINLAWIAKVSRCPRWCCSLPWSCTARRPPSTTTGLRGVCPGPARRHPTRGAGGPVRIRLPRCSVTFPFAISHNTSLTLVSREADHPHRLRHLRRQLLDRGHGLLPWILVKELEINSKH